MQVLLKAATSEIPSNGERSIFFCLPLCWRCSCKARFFAAESSELGGGGGGTGGGLLSTLLRAPESVPAECEEGGGGGELGGDLLSALLREFELFPGTGSSEAEGASTSSVLV